MKSSSIVIAQGFISEKKFVLHIYCPQHFRKEVRIFLSVIFKIEMLQAPTFILFPDLDCLCLKTNSNYTRFSGDMTLFNIVILHCATDTYVTCIKGQAELIILFKNDLHVICK